MLFVLGLDAYDRRRTFHPPNIRMREVEAAAKRSDLGTCSEPAPLQAEQNHPSESRSEVSIKNHADKI